MGEEARDEGSRLSGAEVLRGDGRRTVLLWHWAPQVDTIGRARPERRREALSVGCGMSSPSPLSCEGGNVKSKSALSLSRSVIN